MGRDIFFLFLHLIPSRPFAARAFEISYNTGSYQVLLVSSHAFSPNSRLSTCLTSPVPTSSTERAHDLCRSSFHFARASARETPSTLHADRLAHAFSRPTRSGQICPAASSSSFTSALSSYQLSVCRPSAELPSLPEPSLMFAVCSPRAGCDLEESEGRSRKIKKDRPLKCVWSVSSFSSRRLHSACQKIHPRKQTIGAPAIPARRCFAHAVHTPHRARKRSALTSNNPEPVAKLARPHRLHNFLAFHASGCFAFSRGKKTTPRLLSHQQGETANLPPSLSPYFSPSLILSVSAINAHIDSPPLSGATVDPQNVPTTCMLS